MAIAIAPGLRWTYATKIGLAAGLVVLADMMFWGSVPSGAYGSIIGGFAMAWALASALAHGGVRKSRAAQFGLGVAAFLALILFYEPSLLGWLLFWSALSIAVLLPRMLGKGDAWHWFWRLIVHGLTSLFGPLMDMRRTASTRRRTGRISITAMLPNLVLPLVGGLAFLILFALANPIISDGLADITIAGFDFVTILRLIFASLVLVMVWATLRPRRQRFQIGQLKDSEAGMLWGVNTASVTMSMILFNLIFAVQNGLDIAFIWSGARLPEAYTLAEYAHRGAYPLIGTALLAGFFILITTHPKSEMAGNRQIRALVMVWVAQNLFLVASTMERTFLYIESYSLTRLRIAALLWMGLVAVGLVLISWRALRNKSLPWLVNSNAIAGLTLLAGCALVDLGGIAAGWNVRHAREVGGKGVQLDLCYLNQLGASSVLPLWELELREGLQPAFKERVRNVRRLLQQDLVDAQADPKSWSVRGTMRLGKLPADKFELHPRDYQCDGSYAPETSTEPAATELPVIEAPAQSSQPTPLTESPSR